MNDDLPYMPLFPKDVLAQAVNLDALERGALWSLMFACWMEGGWLDADPRRLARTAAVETRRWDDVWAAIERFFEVDGVRIHHPAVTAALSEAITKRAGRKAIARLGGAAKAAKARLADSTTDSTPVSTQTATDEQPYGATVSAPTVCHPSPSPAPPEEISPPARASDPTVRVTGHQLLTTFARLRAEVYPGSLPWNTGTTKPEKASRMADSLEGDALAEADIEPTMRLVLERAKESQDPRDRETAFAFGVWVSKFHDLREEIHNRRPAGRSKPPPAPYCGGHRGGKNNLRRSPTPSDACPECQHVARMERPRPAGEPEPFKMPDPRETWPKAAGGNT